MRQVKKVAIIGAGPSGLVMAKTLLHHYPKGSFEPVIFDTKPTVGGLWAVTRPDDIISAQDVSSGSHIDDDGQSEPDFIDCFMRTNLSRFTVSFSDHHYHHHIGGRQDGDVEDLFPQAWQVGGYLKSYAEKFIPRDVLRLSCRVVRTQRNADATASGRWAVEWTDLTGSTAQRQGEAEAGLVSESFDYLVVASGYFSRPYNPSIAGLDEFPPERVIHSSTLRSNSQLLQNCLRDSPGGKIVVVGGSMSGAEAAASIALDLSSTTPQEENTGSSSIYPVHHVFSRPFWAVPTYLPASDQFGSFLPLDIVMYDLARRPPGDIQYALGAVTLERASIIHAYFKSLIGSDQSDVAAALAFNAEHDRKSAPWVAVTDHYAGYVRAGNITPSLGRVSAAHWVTTDAHGRGSGVFEIEKHEEGTSSSTTIIDNVAAVVLATGFTPFDSLSFLPEDILAALEFTQDDSVFPIVLDEKGVWNPEIPDLGFVGMYRGPYWGVMEMQARSLAHRWSCANEAHDETRSSTDPNLGKVRDLRMESPSAAAAVQLRAQFPMGDYVGLMETFARELSIPRLPLSADTQRDNDRSGPVIPARYFVPSSSDSTSTASDEDNASASSSIIASLQGLLQPSSKTRQYGLCRAVLRALHGKWQYERVTTSSPETASPTTSSTGLATVHPRKVFDSNAGFKIEYIYEESSIASSSSSPRVTTFRPREDGYIHTTRSDTTANTDSNSNHHRPIPGKIEFISAVKGEVSGDGEDLPYQYQQVAREREVTTSSSSDASSTYENSDQSLSLSREYTFSMTGATITSWTEHVEDRPLKTVRITKYKR